MTWIWIPIGLAFPTLAGWLALRLAEGNTPVLYRTERWIAGFVLGGILTTYVIFLTEITGIGSFTFLSMLVTQLLLIGGLGGIFWIKRREMANKKLQIANCKLQITKGKKAKSKLQMATWQKILIGVASVWISAKLIAAFILLSGPAYFDDTVSNWNMRGKAFFIDKELALHINPEIGSYPQSVPLLKTWLAHVNGQWHEGLVNSVHLLWYVSALFLVFFALRRLIDTKWALAGTYLLSSIPLYLMHGSAAYADAFLSVVLFLAVSWIFFAAQSRDTKESFSFLRIGAIAAGLAVFTKNEAILLHLPLVLVLAAFVCAFTKQKIAAAWYALSVAAVAVPWVAFKWLNNLSFGNAKEVSGMTLEWHEGVLHAIAVNTFFEGNWLLLPVLFFGLVAVLWRFAFRSPLVIPLLFVLGVLIGQLPIYMLTPLHVEAINQTGYARGIIHLVPLIVMITTVLLWRGASGKFQKNK